MVITEYAIWKVLIRNKAVHILGLYPLPANSKDKTINMFIDEITELLPSMLTKENLINNFTAPILDGDTNLNQACHQFSDQL